MDKGKNNSGKLLINLCTGQNLFIMNARVGSGINIGELTCRNASACNFSFSHFFGFSQCVLYYLKHLYHYLQKHCFQKLY
jgi:hypothetical protein